MNLRHLLTIACTLSLGLASSAWALPADAGSTDTAGDATATAPDATIGGDTSATGLDPCWVSKCPKEFAACQADANCVAFVLCNYDNTCIQAIAGITQASGDLGTAFQKCGGKACTDASAGSCTGKCGNFIAADKCHCDDPCVDYGDCCSDQAKICGPGSCAGSDCSDGSTGTYIDKSASQCTCDSAGDSASPPTSCGDYATTCAGKTPTCTPACTNKDNTPKTCGPDGCGGSCGTCKAGEKCVSGACNAGTTGGTDTVSGGTDGTVADAGSLAIDTGATPDTGAGAGGGGGSAKSGCTAGTTSNGSAGWASALVGLGLLVAKRRRRA